MAEKRPTAIIDVAQSIQLQMETLARLLPEWVKQNGDEDPMFDALTSFDSSLDDIVEYIEHRWKES